MLIFISFFIILIPVFTTISMVVPKITLLFTNGSVTMEALKKADAKIQNLTGFKLLNAENLDNLQSRAGTFITDFLSQSMSILTDIVLMYLFLYYFLVNTGKLEEYLEDSIPLSEDKMDKFANELEAQTRSNAVGIPLLALCQGIVAALGYWIFGIPEPVFWGIMTGFFSLLPMIGSALIWVPAGIYQLSAGSTWQGIGILLFGALIIGLIDNVFRFVFQKKFADIHPLITVFGVIVGLQLFGLVGLIFGPLLISYFLILLKIVQEEMIST
jgi:predicted PurR-regulated permease PerM